MNTDKFSQAVKISVEDKRILWHYKLDHGCKTFSEAIRLAIKNAEASCKQHSKRA